MKKGFEIKGILLDFIVVKRKKSLVYIYYPGKFSRTPKSQKTNFLELKIF